jgi:hypothetical protein
MKTTSGEQLTLKLRRPITAASWGDAARFPEVRRAIKTRRQAIKRKLDPGTHTLTTKERNALRTELDLLALAENQFWGVVHKREKQFLEYGGKFPTADVIICNAIARRCLESDRPHLMTPKLAAMFPEVFAAELQREMKGSAKVRDAVRRIQAGQITAGYNDNVGWLIAEHYFDSKVLPKPLSRMSRDEAVRQLKKHFGKQITVDVYRRYVKTLYLREYT